MLPIRLWLASAVCRARTFVARWGLLSVVFFALLPLPLLVQALLPSGTVQGENRRLSPPPELPRSLTGLVHWPAAADAWLMDQFGLRGAMIRVNNWLRYRLFDEIPTRQIVQGRHGRLFLGNADGQAEDRMILNICGAGVSSAEIQDATRQAADFLWHAVKAGLDAAMLIVPTAPRLYARDLPERLARACAASTPPIDRVAAALIKTPGLPPVIYPVKRMLALEQTMPVIPREHFHWAGEAPVIIARDVVDQVFGLRRTMTLPLAVVRRSSDLNGLAPGIGESTLINEPDVRAAGIRTCPNIRCGPIAGVPATAAMAIERYFRAGEGPPMLIIADSFGDEIGRDFSEYSPEVWLLSTNSARALSENDRAALMQAVLARFRGQRVVFVYHDQQVLLGMEPIGHLLWQQ
jgi:hypothetical protein